MIRVLIATVTLATLSLIASPASARIPSSLPQTSAVYQDLASLQSECDQTIRLAAQLREATRGVRKNVDQSIEVTKAIKAMDKRLAKLIDRLKPYASVPKVRTVTRTLSKNLQRIHDQLHALSRKSDRCERELLRPTQKRLKDLEQSLAGAEHKLRGLKQDIAEKMMQLDQASQIAQHTSLTRQTLESTARTFRQATSASLDGVRQIRQQIDVVGDKLQALNQYASSFDTVGKSLNDLDRKIRTPEELVTNLDKAIGKKLTIKIPFSKKSVSFTVRQILEKPGEVISVVLKPLEVLADKILQPILGKMNLEIKSPKGLRELEQKLASLSSLNRTLGSACDKLVGQLNTRIDLEQTRLKAIRISIPTTPRITQQPNETNPDLHHNAPPTFRPVTRPAPTEPTPPRMFLSFGT